ncbi:MULTISPECIES: P-II family nitrogen regulator [Desulfosporosinus]|nr:MULTISPECIES: P-II family nitrogen regulator [Desulfosporosinus]MCB8814257.1 P-II family nitrogen regulator [Desulfosporosinus sp. SRJS8]MCO1600877.1 P-II family nitrogen regulator [Desulfosporosinus nitroreducens]MDA8223578.1 P-II family nitrogen regulator [Desulfitobacterium hafniense]MDO0821912.1 P-II family nitrogen regulator [Desulfosporosinus nitroreducens]
MKEIMMVIRRHQVPATKKAFEDAGFPALTIQSVEGRGKQGGIGGWAAEIDPELNSVMGGENTDEPRFHWIPKRLLTLVVQDDQVEDAVGVIIKANQTGHMGDGKIFVCPLKEVVRVRTGEVGKEAVV